MVRQDTGRSSRAPWGPDDARGEGVWGRLRQQLGGVVGQFLPFRACAEIEEVARAEIGKSPDPKSVKSPDPKSTKSPDAAFWNTPEP